MDPTVNPSKSATSPDQETAWKNYVEDFRGAGHETVEWIARYFNSVADLPVLARARPGELLDALPASAPQQAVSYAAVLPDFHRTILPALAQRNQPRFFAYFALTAST